MPLYEYQCDTCGHRFEAIQKFSDPPLEQCPKCSGVIRKLQSAPAIQFKGAGWYITDYAKKDGGTAGTPGKSSEPTPEGATSAAGKGTGDSGAAASTSASSTPASSTPAASGGKSAT